MLLIARRRVLSQTLGYLQHSAGSTSSNSAAQATLSTLAILEQKDGKLNTGSLSAIEAAKKLGGPIHGFVAGGNVQAAAQDAAKLEGIDKIVAVENAAYDKVRSAYSPLTPVEYMMLIAHVHRDSLKTSHLC